jgi:hypothetical protein
MNSQYYLPIRYAANYKETNYMTTFRENTNYTKIENTKIAKIYYEPNNKLTTMYNICRRDLDYETIVQVSLGRDGVYYNSSYQELLRIITKTRPNTILNSDTPPLGELYWHDLRVQRQARKEH